MASELKVYESICKYNFIGGIVNQNWGRRYWYKCGRVW